MSGWTPEDAANLAHVAKASMSIAASLRDIADAALSKEVDRIQKDRPNTCPNCASTVKPHTFQALGAGPVNVCKECEHEWTADPVVAA